MLEEVKTLSFRGEHHLLLSCDLEVAHRCWRLALKDGKAALFGKLALMFEPAHVVVSITLSEL